MAAAHPTALQTYSRTAARSARLVLGEYSTSFSLACRMLDAASAAHIANIYALVRLADEVVDGVASQAGLNPQAVGDCLDELQQQTALALQRGYSTNLVVHAFALTARETSITTELTDPFFASMRADLSVHRHSEQSLREYIYGSAEVVGLMCLQVFRTMPGAPAESAAQTQLVERAARSLGAAFQKVNFLRDVATDSGQLDRVYFPGTDLEHFTEEHKRNLVQDIEADLAHARAGLPYLAPAAARAVRMAHDLFARLNRQLAKAPADQLLSRRISVSAPRKALIAARVLATSHRRRGPGPEPDPGQVVHGPDAARLPLNGGPHAA
ncbi:phytoene/squalene synthase family protein [Glutamicibacter protophormiae]|uniref:phytoene/squalene synthase family protein n=1 Tax=Glutamicibacter protophormiae TaxID=37930 RepID=UPI003319CF97